MTPPDSDDCLHPSDVRLSDGSIECQACKRVIPPPDLVERVEGSPRDLFAQARAKIAKARELEPTDDDDRPAA